jgi:hypothetical protein
LWDLSVANPDPEVKSSGRIHNAASYVQVDPTSVSAFALFLMTMTVKKTVFWDVTKCSFTDG